MNTGRATLNHLFCVVVVVAVETLEIFMFLLHVKYLAREGQTFFHPNTSVT